MRSDTSTFSSPFSWRYGSSQMRYLFSEEYKFHLWRNIWVALAKAQKQAGLVSIKELADLQKHQDDIDIERILAIEKDVKHDVVAAIREFAEKAKVGGGKIHYADMPCMGYTHLQPAEPTTVGYRLAFYAQDLLTDYELLQFVKTHLKAKGFKGAVGTSASYSSLLKGTKMTASKMEEIVMDTLGIAPAIITTQVYSRKVDYFILTLLASIASSIAKFASDLRILQSPHFGEWSEPFGKSQVGSSAMPFKKNPIKSENICSLARYVEALPSVALQNASHSYLERTLDDSANRRIIIPEAFLAVDHLLITAEKIINNMMINETKIAFNLAQYAPFAATEIMLMETVKNGANRQEMHEVLRETSLQAWTAIQNGQENPMIKLLAHNPKISKYLKKEQIEKLLDVRKHIGTAPERALKIVQIISKLH
ncbi:MAG: Adenylosuccinate lyase [Candidatus Roizmanbacteria bacterium GW2011_GWA2_37_7]|uniref:Adenylosuccinate lyase n=1 Tax=Candidatus Roizmanbacteria bacterium GW2011_GWA2_37_7 TaxID=1618481 RepID=A0A0G0H6L9_9BACT|nr:MAG: Adenylosuccinate lyase [Candidatus Roizmanbacteria bacterium GW2011_GWA2_37_7]